MATSNESSEQSTKPGLVLAAVDDSQIVRNTAPSCPTNDRYVKAKRMKRVPGAANYKSCQFEASIRLVDFIIKHFKDYEILLTHVHCTEVYPIVDGAGGAFFASDAQDDLYNAAEDREVLFVVNTLCPRLRDAGVKFRSELVRSNGVGTEAISKAVCKRAEKLKPDFLVLSKQSKNALSIFFLGSVCKECIKHAPCPVVIV